MNDRLKMVIGVHLILRRGNKILLARRFNTGFADGSYNFPCGHLDPAEGLAAALVREASEEIGIKIKKKDLTFVGCTHWQSNKQSVNFFFECKKWTGSPTNLELDKCDDISWFALNKLPRNLVSQTRDVLTVYARKKLPFLVEKRGK